MPTQVLVVHAHQDDETLSTGAYIAALAANGYRVSTMCLTNGEASQAKNTVGTQIHTLRDGEQSTYVGVIGDSTFRIARDNEMRAAATILINNGPYPGMIMTGNLATDGYVRAEDGQLTSTGAATAIKNAITKLRQKWPNDPVSFLVGPSVSDTHPDHQQLAKAMPMVKATSGFTGLTLKYAIAPDNKGTIAATTTYSYSPTDPVGAVVVKALWEYCKPWQPLTRMAIGDHSVKAAFTQQLANPKTMLHN